MTEAGKTPGTGREAWQPRGLACGGGVATAPKHKPAPPLGPQPLGLDLNTRNLAE